MDSFVSKSELKRRAKNIEELVNELADLPVNEINSLPCGRSLRDEISASKNLKGGARKRQLKYATKLLRENPVEELYDFLARKKGSRLKAKRDFQKLEHLRNLLITEALQLYEEKMQAAGSGNGSGSFELPHNSEMLAAVVRQLPEVDQDKLKNAVRQFAETRHRKFRRELFRILKAAAEKAQFSPQQDEKNGI